MLAGGEGELFRAKALQANGLSQEKNTLCIVKPFTQR